MADNIEIAIMNQRFLLKRGQASESYVQELANYVDHKMREIQDRTKSVATLNVAILAALNIADEFFKKKEELSKLKHDVRDDVKRAIELVETELNLH